MTKSALRQPHECFPRLEALRPRMSNLKVSNAKMSNRVLIRTVPRGSIRNVTKIKSNNTVSITAEMSQVFPVSWSDLIFSSSWTTFLLLALRTPPASNCCVVIDFCCSLLSLKKLQYLIQIWVCLSCILLHHPSRWMFGVHCGYSSSTYVV